MSEQQEQKRLRSLIKLIESPNLAKDLDEEELTEIANDVIVRTHEDEQSMKDWSDCVEEGLKLCKPEFKPLSSPWDGAANFKSTLLTEASNQFGNRASIELFRDDKLVKTQILGIKTINNVIEKNFNAIKELTDAIETANAQLAQIQQSGGDVSDMQKMIADIQSQVDEKEKKIKEKKLQIRAKTERSDRVSEAMNWQINNKMTDWRKDHKRMMYVLPNVGSLFVKTYYDETIGSCRSDVINYPNFAINQSSVSIDDARSFTHFISVSKNKAKERQLAGIWLDCDIYSDELNGDEGSNEKERADSDKDNRNRYLEQYCWLDLDDDGYEEPYIVTVHEASSQVLRIVARFDYNDIYVKFGKKVYSLDDAIKARAQAITQKNREFGTKEELPDSTDLTGFSVVRIEPKKIITKYGFIPSYDGTFLDVGYFHLIGAITLAVNKSTNDLLNNATLSNTNGGFTAKGFRKKQGPMKIKPGEWLATEVPADQLQSSMMPWPFKEPSQTLFALNEKLDNIGRSFTVNADIGSQIQSNTAPTTALAMIQESMMNQTAHMSHISTSMSEEFGILYKLNRDYLDPEEYKVIVGDDEAAFQDDFNTDGLSVICTANPELASRMQRMMLADAEMAQVPIVMQAGGNPIPIIKNYFDRIGSDNIDEIFPNEAEMSPQDKQQVAAMKQSQDQANAMQQAQLKMLDTQTQLLMKGEERKDAEFELSKRETLSKMDEILEGVEKIKAETMLTVQKAITEHVNNGLSITTALSNEMDKAYQMASDRDEVMGDIAPMAMSGAKENESENESENKAENGNENENNMNIQKATDE